jgi:hypothetical protein
MIGKFEHGLSSGIVGELTSTIRGTAGDCGGELYGAAIGAAGGACGSALTGGNVLEGALHGVCIDQFNHAAHAVKDAISPPSEDRIINTKAARRALEGTQNPGDIIAHTAEFVTTEQGVQYIIEYLGDGKVYSTKIEGVELRREGNKPGTVQFDFNGYAWTMQAEGFTAEPRYSVLNHVEWRQARADARGKYTTWSNNCTVSSEEGRARIGASVKSEWYHRFGTGKATE